MRFGGVITRWDDERGFGFIEPAAGGEPVFVHIKAFRSRSGRPANGMRVEFSVELGAEGKKCATEVDTVRVAQPERRRARRSPVSDPSVGGRVRLAPWLALAAFATLFAFAALVWPLPRVVGYWYGGASVLTFLLYAADKSAAERGGWRIREQTLHMLALIGGWPGAVVGQQLLRHKRSKASFQWVFWTAALFNVSGFLLLVSPFGQALAGR
jgi:uncharacterized membrane protein YsdA (DUF1294 family)/cold shock CspA family protein